MTFRERVLYHQVHPVKLMTDVLVTIPAGYLFWQHNLTAAITISLGPPLIVSAGILLSRIDLEHYKRSALGQYLAVYMTSFVEAVRLLGFVVAAIGFWFHNIWLVLVGILIVVLAWLRGLLAPKRCSADKAAR